MAAAKNHSHPAATYRLCFVLLSMATLSSVVSTTDSPLPLCSIPSPAPGHVPAGKDTLPLIHSFQLSSGYFFGGEDIHFAKDDSDGNLLHPPRSFTLLLLQVQSTTNSTVMHVGATLTLSGRRAFHAVAAAHHRRDRFAGGGGHSVSFHLDGYYSTSAELCMLGSGTYSMGDGWPKHLPDVVLRLRVPSTPSLNDPFVTGELKGAGFDAIALVSYAEGDGYEYGRRASCPPLQPPPAAVRGALQAPGGSFSCARLREQLVSSYKLQHGGSSGVPASSTSPALQEPRMHVGQVQCTADGAVRLYATFSNNTNLWGAQYLRRPGFVVKEAAAVAEGRWHSTQSTLCLRACRVVARARSAPTSLSVQEQRDCSIGMSFWFPAVWTIRDRSVVAGRLWNSRQGAAAAASNAAAAAAGAVLASSIDFDISRDTFADVNYTYTTVDEAKQRYFADVLRSHESKANKGRFPSANYTYHDFKFRFYMKNTSGHGEAYPVTVGSAMANEDRLAAGDSFSSWRAKVDLAHEHELLKVSYDILLATPNPDNSNQIPTVANWYNRDELEQGKGGSTEYR